MKGNEPIIEMRLKGKQPEWVFINDFPSSVDWTRFNDFATVCVAGDKIRTLDMRFLVGCKVSIASLSERRAKALFEACKPYADLVAVGVVNPNESPIKQTGYTELWQR